MKYDIDDKDPEVQELIELETRNDLTSRGTGNLYLKRISEDLNRIAWALERIAEK
jgi:hypothetical protein